MTEIREIASGLEFPEGPIAMSDGSVLVVEIKRGTLTRVHPDGAVERVAETGGGPNGAAIGPDGKVYICNNGGFEWHDVGGMPMPGDQPAGILPPGEGQPTEFWGAVFDCYEFKHPMDDRLTDEAWQEMKERPERPAWYSRVRPLRPIPGSRSGSSRSSARNSRSLCSNAPAR